MATDPKDIIARARQNRTGPVHVEMTPTIEAPALEDVPEAIRPLVTMLLPYVQPNIKPAQLRALVDDAVLRLMPRTTSIIVKREGEEGEGIKIDLVHKTLSELVRQLNRQPYSRRGVMAVGPAGSAKSTAAEQAAQVLVRTSDGGIGMECYLVSLGPQTSKGDLVGFVDAHGNPVWTAIRTAYTHGGLLCLDEIDASNAGVLTILNALLAQSRYRWPDGTATDRHVDFRFMAAANTYGTGGNLQYIGRNILDAASIDRFRTLLWDYDVELEKALAIRAATSVPGAVESAAGLAIKWAARCASLRTAAEKAGVKIVISPRAIISGAAALADGDSMEKTEHAEIWREGGISRDDRERILSHV